MCVFWWFFFCICLFISRNCTRWWWFIFLHWRILMTPISRRQFTSPNKKWPFVYRWGCHGSWPAGGYGSIGMTKDSACSTAGHALGQYLFECVLAIFFLCPRMGATSCGQRPRGSSPPTEARAPLKIEGASPPPRVSPALGGEGSAQWSLARVNPAGIWKPAAPSPSQPF